MKPRRYSQPAQAALALVVVTLLAIVFPHSGLAQPDDDDDGGGPPARPVGPAPAAGGGSFKGSLQVVKGPKAAPGPNAKLGGIDIFPQARELPMSVHGTDPIPIERARRGGDWMCKGGACNAAPGVAGESLEGNRLLKTITVRTPAMPVPVTIWRRRGARDAEGTLDFDPGRLSHWTYNHVCAYPPIDGPNARKPTPTPEKMEKCVDGKEAEHRPDMGEIHLGFEWPRETELAGFKYLAVVDSCGNALVYPFQRNFFVPAVDVVTGPCNGADGRVLRIFPSGTFLRVTAFNLESAAAEDVVQVTYRVSVPPLENYSQTNPAKVLFPDFKLNELVIDCAPEAPRGPVDKHGRPLPPGPLPPPGDKDVPHLEEVAPPPAAKPAGPPPVPGEEPPVEPSGQYSPEEMPTGPPGLGPPPPSRPGVPVPAAGPPKGPPPPGATSGREGAKPGQAPPPSTAKSSKELEAGVGAKPLNHGTLVISPDPLRDGNCRIEWRSPLRARLPTPLALHVELYRTDHFDGSEPKNLIPDDHQTWIVTPNDYVYYLPPLRQGFDGDSRLKLIIRSDPLNPNGQTVLMGDATRVAAQLHSRDSGSTEELARRTVGSVTIHSVPLCGEDNFETLEEAGSCVRGYLTIPAMLATLQITRAPWIERPLITRSILSAVGVAFAFDSYDPVSRSAFPVAGQVGGFVQNLEDNRIGLMGYVGVAPTLPILGEGGNTTTFGLLGGIGMMYITNSNGPDEGFKPTAFLSVVVQVGQANPELSGTASAAFGPR